MKKLWIGISLILFGLMAHAETDAQIFQSALASGDTVALKKLVAKKDFDENQILSATNETPVTMAAASGNAEMFGIVVDSKTSKINHQTANGWTALMFAARAQSFGDNEGKSTENDQFIKIVKKLLGLGADKSLKNTNGETALDIAKRSNNLQIAQLLESKTSSNAHTKK